MEKNTQIRSVKFNILLSPYEHSIVKKISKNNKISVAKLFRDSLAFYSIFYEESSLVNNTKEI